MTDSERGLIERKTLHQRSYGAFLSLTANGKIPPGAQLDEAQQRRGKIVTVGSQSGLRAQGGGGGTSYSVAKAAIHQYTRKLAAELGPCGVTVNCIAPGWILSSRAIASGRGSPETRARLEQEIALGRLGEPEDCAKVVEFLVTDLSDYVTGQVIPVCGGVCLF